MAFLIVLVVFVVLCAVAGVIAAFVVMVQKPNLANGRRILEQRARLQVAQEEAAARVRAEQAAK